MQIKEYYEILHKFWGAKASCLKKIKLLTILSFSNEKYKKHSNLSVRILKA